ncbi:hypothetical protein BU15DRAFT_48378 [Melanogaster broomeanus]|nr:hypothetical protein BU15DRAFT_48378 [Melanogaster broomeanus]
MRPLTLHVSALNDSEYNLYTASLDDLSVTGDADPSVVYDDAHYERVFVGAREARAWLRGRYSDLPASDIDAILKLFCPNMLPSDSLSGGQFFAALRLVIHAQSGKGIDRTFAFIQAHPSSAKAQDVPRQSSPVRVSPSHPDNYKPSTSSTSSQDSNPFTRRSMEQPAAQFVVDSEVPVISRRHSQRISHNPFLIRDKSCSGEPARKSLDKVAGVPNVTKDGKLPPLPPRKPAPPPRRTSEAFPATVASTMNLVTPFGLPLIPLKPSHITSPLMKQSLEASKHGQTMKRAEEQLDRERILRVLKATTAGSSVSSRTRSLSPSKHIYALPNSSGSEDGTFIPPLPRRRKPSPPSSSSSSLPSLDEVASATFKPVSSRSPNAPFPPPLPSRDPLVSTNSPSTNADYLSSVLGPSPMPVPPIHPDRRPTTDASDPQSSSNSHRVMRSKSMHYPGAPPLPPPLGGNSKRPESVQLTPTSNTTELPNFPSIASARSHSHSRMSSFQGFPRHISLAHDRNTPESSPIANIQKTISNLQLKTQPKLEAVRYKAEAGISRRGYINHAQFGGTRWREDGEEGLMSDTRWEAANIDCEPYSEPTTDDEPSSGDDRDQQRKSAHSPPDSLTEVDNLKWPPGEGWKQL